MPGDTPNINSHSSIKRYRPASTTPIFSSHRLPATHFSAPQQPLLTKNTTNTLNTTATPYEKRMVNQIQGSLSRAVHAPRHYQPPPPPPTQSNFFHSAPQPLFDNYSKPQTSYDEASSPVWQNTLKRTGVDLYGIQDQHQPQVITQSMAYNKPATTSTFHVGSFSKLSPNNNSQSASSPKSPKIVNLQYNTPIGLYSNNNIKEELHKQVG